MGIFMSIQYPPSVGKVHKILLFETVFHVSASDCTKLTLACGKMFTLIDPGAHGSFSSRDLRTRSFHSVHTIMMVVQHPSMRGPHGGIAA